MKLSFVIPAYNEEAYIGRCVESILADTAGCPFETEIIVVNNNSTDGTRDKASSCPRVRVVDETRKGIVWARQAGYMAAGGDLIANIDADNMLPKGWTLKVFSEFFRNDRLVALSGPLVYYDLPWLYNLQTKLFYGIGYLTYLINHFVIRKGGMVQGGNFVLRRSALESIGGFNTDIDFYGEDTDIARRMQKTGRIKFTFALPMYSSGRRMKGEGFLLTGLRYALNYLWILVFRRPYTKTSKDIRITNE